jgi:folate receptor
MLSVQHIALLCIFVPPACYAADSATSPDCKRFDEIYPTGKELCENMWDGAFEYETDETKAYTMWFFDEVNPNDAMSKQLGKLNASGHDTCHLSYFHKDTPGPEPDAFTECHPWKDNACCSYGTVVNATKLKEGYGAEYHWDRCGPLSPECERFFVQEACFYECDPNAGLWRKFHPSIYNASNDTQNDWQMSKMPIKASYCDAWFTACRQDKFCSSGGGSYFSCAAEYKEADKVAELQAQLKVAEDRAQANSDNDDDDVSTATIVGFVSAGVVIFGLCVFGGCLIMKERSGKPLFGKLLDQPSSSTGGAQTFGSNNI